MTRSVRFAPRQRLSQCLTTGGLRCTPQRQQVYAVLLAKRDHPTAEEVFIRAKREMPDISMATVYNCLEALVQCRLARQVALERGPARFCPNMREHGHFYCAHCERVFDIDLPAETRLALPRGFTAERYDVAVHGRCPACANSRAAVRRHAPTRHNGWKTRTESRAG